MARYNLKTKRAPKQLYQYNGIWYPDQNTLSKALPKDGSPWIYPVIYKGNRYFNLPDLQKAASKYGAVKKTYGGITYDSHKEADYAAKLDILKHATNPSERVVSVERQKVYPLVVNGVKVFPQGYKLDFLVTYADGHVEHVDVKGMLTEVYKAKRQLMLAIHGIKIIEK